jgi:N-acyl-D-aspartate/D-glutamate deacylase
MTPAQDLLLQGGRVVDGSGAPAFDADIRVRGDRILAIAPDLPTAGARVLDASGCFVTPGFIDTHTHYDAALFWDPRCSPIATHGVTTVLIGNCALGLAPVRPSRVSALSALFSFVEDLPRELFETQIPWSWESFPDYARHLSAMPLGVNVCALVSHSLLREEAMGPAAWQRAATPAEAAAIASLTAEALSSGARGLSTSRLDRSPAGELVPSYYADDAEFRAIFEVLGRHGGILQMIPRLAIDDEWAEDLQRMGALARGWPVPVVSNAIYQRPDDPSVTPRMLGIARELRASGVDFRHLASPRSIELVLNFHQCMVFLYVPAWNALVQGGLDPAERMRRLASAEWRAEARAQWDSVREGFPRPGAEHILRIVSVGRPELEPWLGQSLSAWMAGRFAHASDALAYWVLENGLETELAFSYTNTDPDAVAQLMRAEETLVSASDAGAHIAMFDGAGDTTLLLTRHVRDRRDLPLEEAVRRLSAEPARLLRLAGRGLLREGAFADITVFDPEALAWHREERARDLPGGRSRFRRPPGGFRFTLVNGEVVQQDGLATASLPARFLTG